MRFRCVSCNKIVSVEDANPGEMVQCGGCETVLHIPEPFDVGFVIGDYCVTANLGDGRMGTVYKAHQETLVRDVALKVLDHDMAEHADFILEFFKEARVAARLNHPNIVQSYSVNEEEGYYFLVVEYVQGKSLRDVLNENGVMSVPDVLKLMAQVVNALDYAWKAESLGHLAVKPENILISDTLQTKISDIGLAGGRSRLADVDYQYRSPEQIIGASTDTRADIYSLGVTVYEALAGNMPFSGNKEDLERAHLETQAVPLRELNSKVSKDMSLVVQKMMAKHPDDRYNNFAELDEDLRILRMNYSSANKNKKGHRAASIFETRSGGSVNKRRDKRRRQQLRLQVVTAIVTVLVLVGIIMFDRGGQATTQSKVRNSDKERIKDFSALSRSMRNSVSTAEALDLLTRIDKFLAHYPKSPQVEECLEWRGMVLEVLIRDRRLNEFELEENIRIQAEENAALDEVEEDEDPESIELLALSSEQNGKRLDLLRFYLQKKKADDIIVYLNKGLVADPEWSENMIDLVNKASLAHSVIYDSGEIFAGTKIAVNSKKPMKIITIEREFITLKNNEGKEISVSLSSLPVRALESLLKDSLDEEANEHALSLLFWYRQYPVIYRKNAEDLDGFEEFLNDEASEMEKLDIQVHLNDAERFYRQGEMAACNAQLQVLRQKYRNSDLYAKYEDRIMGLAPKKKKKR